MVFGNGGQSLYRSKGATVHPWVAYFSSLEFFVARGYDTTLIAESEEELKSLLMKMKEESEKVCLKLNFKILEN